MKLFNFFVLFLFTGASTLFAQIVPAGLTTLSQNIEEIFTGPIVTTILVCCLAGCGIAYAFNKDNEKMKRNIIAIGIGIVIIATAAGIVSAVFSASS